MSSRPTGTVTFLFTDIEGSTKMWEEHGAAMRNALESHDRILRSAIEEGDGYVFTTAGDAFAAAFSDPRLALASAVTAQRAIHQADWSDLGTLGVRMALHTGLAHERDGDYFGPALNRAARILSAGHGGQILMSLGTEEIVGPDLDGMSLKDLGEHTLKDLGRPERIFQVVHPDLEGSFPDLLSLDAFPNNLPIQLTSFVGRQLELNEVVKRLHDSRLLTLTGVGGSGKTRLSLQAAAESASDYPNGVWLVELASIGDTDLVPLAIADVLGLTRSQGGSGNSQLGTGAGSILDQVTGHLSHRTCLLVLDNCEHLITATARVVQHLLQHCPQLTVMATSREGLGVPGEVLWQVPSLGAAEDDPMESDAVRLFVERAQDANPRFAIDDETLRWVRQLVERLDGMPLAIELAAARARVLDAKQIAERLDDRFRLLTGGSRTALPRHQTLEATVDWSYDLMDQSEKLVFQRLAAFRGGFTLEAAEAICAGGSVEPYEVLDLIGHLVDKSMVVRDEVTGRFGMLETLRQYALRKLTESDEVDTVRVKHLDYFSGFAAEASPKLNGPDEAIAYHAFAQDHDNFRAAMAYGLENRLEATAAMMAADLFWYWWAASDVAEGLEWLRRAHPFRDRLNARAGVVLQSGVSLFSGFQLEEGAKALADEAIDMARAAGDPVAEAIAHMARGYASFAESDFTAVPDHFERMRECGLRSSGDEAPWLTANANLMLGLTHRIMSRLEVAAEYLAEAERLYRRVGQPSGLGWVLSVAGQVARYRGEFEEEIRKQQEARAIFDRMSAPFQIVFTLVNEAISLTLLGQAEEAIVLSRRAIVIERELALTLQALESLSLGAWFEQEAGNLLESLELHEEAMRFCAPHFDQYRMELVAIHVVGLFVEIERWDDAARADGFHLANLSRPEAEVYDRHWRAWRDAYRGALGNRTRTLLEEGGAMSPKDFHDHILQVLTDLRARLTAP